MYGYSFSTKSPGFFAVSLVRLMVFNTPYKYLAKGTGVTASGRLQQMYEATRRFSRYEEELNLNANSR